MTEQDSNKGQTLRKLEREELRCLGVQMAHFKPTLVPTVVKHKVILAGGCGVNTLCSTWNPREGAGPQKGCRVACLVVHSTPQTTDLF